MLKVSIVAIGSRANLRWGIAFPRRLGIAGVGIGLPLRRRIVPRFLLHAISLKFAGSLSLSAISLCASWIARSSARQRRHLWDHPRCEVRGLRANTTRPGATRLLYRYLDSFWRKGDQSPFKLARQIQSWQSGSSEISARPDWLGSDNVSEPRSRKSGNRDASSSVEQFNCTSETESMQKHDGELTARNLPHFFQGAKLLSKTPIDCRTDSVCSRLIRNHLLHAIQNRFVVHVLQSRSHLISGQGTT
jgi:hypothetical protein